jgi:hypothetical protein
MVWKYQNLRLTKLSEMSTSILNRELSVLAESKSNAGPANVQGRLFDAKMFFSATSTIRAWYGKRVIVQRTVIHRLIEDGLIRELRELFNGNSLPLTKVSD